MTRSEDDNMPCRVYSSGPVTMYYEGASSMLRLQRKVLLSDGTNTTDANNNHDSSAVYQAYAVTNGIIEGAAFIYMYHPSNSTRRHLLFATGGKRSFSRGAYCCNNSMNLYRK